MNLLFVISALKGGGAEGVMCTLANKLVEKGHRVTLVTTNDCKVYNLSDKVNLIESCSWDYDTFYGSLPVRFYKKIANRYLDLKNLHRIIKKEKPDIAMSFLIQWLWQLILLCKWRIPLVFCDRNAYELPVGHFSFFTKRVLFRMADMVQVMSYHDKAYLRNRYKRVAALPNPLRYPSISLEEYEAGFKQRNNILACGRIVKQKGFDKLILAFSKISKEFPDWNVDICGQGKEPYVNKLINLTKQLGLEYRINFIGFHKDIDRIMREHSIFCLSSENEGFPNVLSEAMANGMACLAFDVVTGPREIIIDGLDGMIVNNQDIEALASGLKMMIDNEGMRYKYGKHAIENIKRFNTDKVVDKWEDMFKNLICEYKK